MSQIPLVLQMRKMDQEMLPLAPSHRRERATAYIITLLPSFANVFSFTLLTVLKLLFELNLFVFTVLEQHEEKCKTS